MKPSFRIFGIIPARFGSTRLPAKVLADIAGKTLIRRVYERARRSPALSRLAVATDDGRVFEEVKRFGGEAIITAFDHPSGTDRVCEAARIMQAGEGDLIVNIQADQPLFEPGMIEEIVAPFRRGGDLAMAVLVHPLADGELHNPGVVKVVFDREGFALYFSRSPVPYVMAHSPDPPYHKHIGPYAYRMGFLEKFTRLERGRLEQAESLEQLRALEHGFRLKTVATRFDSPEVDTPEDLERVRARVARQDPSGI